MIFFKELMKLETVENNPIRDTSKRKTIKKIRELLSENERVQIDKYLKQHFYSFWIFVNIFFHSGAKENEMLSPQAKDVHIKNIVLRF